MKNLFNSIQLKKPKKNYFDLTHDVKLTTQMGKLTPVMIMDCVPGDSVNISAQTIIRFAPMLAPVMHRIDVSIHYFFVPNRILWDGWEDYITNHNSGLVAPTINISAFGEYTPDQLKFLSYMGINLMSTGEKTGSENVSAFPFSAYQAIYNEYYRDQNLEEEIDYKLTEGDNTAEKWITQRRRAWQHDYFTASLPFAQKGDAVDIPIGKIQGDAPINYDTTVIGDFGTGQIEVNGTGGPYNFNIEGSVPENIGSNEMFAKTDGMNIEATTINDLRRAFRLQEWLEKNARGGTRYIESILTHFGVKSSDARLQRPEYITGVKTPVVISEVLNTTGTIGDEGAPQGNMSGHAISVGTGKGGKYYCEEHGWIIGLMSVMPKTAYQQGIAKMYLRTDPLEYFWPTFANIGEQEVLNKEIYAFQGTNAGKRTFGYVPRYAEYKFIPSRVAGDFSNNLSYWHLGRIFENAPALNADFIKCSPRKDIFAVTDPNEDELYCQVLNVVNAVRPMPKYGTPMF